MSWTVALVLALLWFLALVSSYATGGLIHMLLGIALIVLVVRSSQGRRIAVCTQDGKGANMNVIHPIRNRVGVFVATLLLAGLPACSPQQATSADDAAARPASRDAAENRVAEAVRIIVPQGTEIDVTLSTDVGSETSQVGDTVTATTHAPVVIGDRVAIPANSTLQGRVTSVLAGTKGLKISEKGGMVVLAFDTVRTPRGSSAPISASITKIASSKGKTGGIIGGSAAGGALLGKILGGDTKDAAVGAVVGGAIGTGIAAGTKGKELKIPAGTHLTMILDQDLSIVDRS